MTYNEEANIARCIESVRGVADEIFVLDSFSSDDTVAIAQQLGARVAQHEFKSYAGQRRLMVSMATHDRIFTLDADEYLSDELKVSVLAAKEQFTHDAYTSNRRSSIGHTWLRHGSWYPDKKIRMFDRRKAAVSGDDVHESIETHAGARIAHLQGDLLHQADENIHARYEKVNKYTTRAAVELYAKGKRGAWWRVWLKPIVRFISSYIFRLGWLDGFYGYVVAKSEAHYVWLREVKLLELGKK